MNLYKKSDRIISASVMLKALRDIGGQTKHIGEYDKWKELKGLESGCRLQVKLDIYKVVNNGNTGYLIADTMGMVAAEIQQDLNEVYAWLKEHGYKSDKRWYMEDCGMTEETWNAWNGNEEI